MRTSPVRLRKLRYEVSDRETGYVSFETRFEQIFAYKKASRYCLAFHNTTNVIKLVAKQT
jgi:hypothetical protein